jgi:hypothetical protein
LYHNLLRHPLPPPFQRIFFLEKVVSKANDLLSSAYLSICSSINLSALRFSISCLKGESPRAIRSALINNSDPASPAGNLRQNVVLPAPFGPPTIYNYGFCFWHYLLYLRSQLLHLHPETFQLLFLLSNNMIWSTGDEIFVGKLFQQ